MAGTFKFELVTPERMVLSQDASQVVVPGIEGAFTVLPGHAPVISALRPGVVDATLNPDFSQVALDEPQLAGNTRFALSFPEKRPFFFESSDLLRSPTEALYTRSLTAPRWGLRSTWRGAPNWRRRRGASGCRGWVTWRSSRRAAKR